MENIFSILFVLFIIAALAAILSQYLKKRSLDYRRFLLKAEQALAGGNLELALTYYEHAIGLQQARPDPRSEVKSDLGKAYYGVGSIYERKNEPCKAFENYQKAKQLGAALSPNAIALMAYRYAESYARDQAAVETYLHYIQLYPAAELSSRIYALLEEACRFDEIQGASQRKLILAANEKVVAANPRLEWAHFNLGALQAAEGNFAAATTALKKALQLNQNRLLTYYWLGKCFVHQPGPDRDQDLLWAFSRFLAEPSADPYLTGKQAEAAFELGRLSIAQLGGFDVDRQSLVEADRNRLAQAIHYFETAIAKFAGNGEYLFHLARAYSLAGLSSQAITTFQQVLAMVPNHQDYLYYLGREYRAANLFDQALVCANRVLVLDANYFEAHKLAAQIYLQTGQNTAAAQYARQALKLQSSCLECLVMLIHALYRNQQFSEVVVEVEKAPPSGINYLASETVFYVARAYAQTGAFATAITWYKALPEVPKVLYYYGCALANSQDSEAAISAFNKVIRRENQYRGRAFLERGHLYRKLDKLQEAERDYLQAVELDPNHLNAINALGLVYYRMGELRQACAYFAHAVDRDGENGLARLGKALSQEKNQEISAAIKEYEMAAGMAEICVIARTRLGILYCRQGNYQKAIEQFNLCWQAGCESETIQYYLGLALLLCNQIDQALELWKNLHRQHPSDERLALHIYRLHYLSGAEYVRQKRYDEAIAAWNEYLKKYTEDEKTKQDLAALYFRVGMGLLRGGEIHDARRQLQEALERHPASPVYAYYYGLCNFLVGNYQECIERFSKLSDLQPDNLRLNYYLGLALLKSGQNREALKALRKVTNRGSADKYARHAAQILANEHIKQGQFSEGAEILAALI